MPLKSRSFMRRIFIYCHDAFGMGNARRMMAISAHLARTQPQANLLLASGSPVIHGFHLPDRVDYIKLPSVARTERDQYATRYLTTTIGDTIRLRAALLTAAVQDFAPDLVLVDKKPFGIMNELSDAMHYLRGALPRTKHVLVLRDILDEPAATMACMASSGFERDVNSFYDMVAVLGTPDVFDMRREYALSTATSSRIAYCGYLRSAPGQTTAAEARAALGVQSDERLVLVTPGGGEDGRALLDTAIGALEALRADPAHGRVRGLVMAGPQVPAVHLDELKRRAAAAGGIEVRDFTNDMSSYVSAADLVVSMAGYNTMCDVLTLAARAVVVPRVRPVLEQSIRATRMAALGWVRTENPDQLTPATLASVITEELRRPARRRPPTNVNLDGLSTLTTRLEALHQPHDLPRVDVPARRAAMVPLRSAL